MQRRAARGFSLVEVMVAVVVICIGMLGIAKMQALSMSNSTISRERALAAFEAAGLAAAMHVNRDFWSAPPFPGNGAFTVSVTPDVTAPATPISVPADSQLQIQANDDFAAPSAGNGVTGESACVGTSAGEPACAAPWQLAAYDLARWASSLGGLLPQPQATINCPNNVATSTPTSCTITITWTETTVGMTQQEAQYQGSNGNQLYEAPSYVLYVQP